MRRVWAIVSLVFAAAAFWGLDNRHGTFPALGKLLNPFAGFWRNGAQADAIPEDIVIPGLRDEVRVVWDDRLTPHIFAKNDHDLFLAQGYVAASLRLWQMDFQSLYTAGRISEVVGAVGLRQDIFTRRFGLPWAAENSLRIFRADPKTGEAVEAFTAGVNARIRDLGARGLPVEFKILDYRPEPWTDFKCALLLKAMAFVLTSYNQDAALTRMARRGGREHVIDDLFPLEPPPLVDPVIPPGTRWDFTPVALPELPARAAVGGAVERTGAARPAARPGPEARERPDERPALGSNNWAVSGRLTKNGFPILCNDMHLELTLPAIWYEVQLAAPGINVRGVTFPAAPFVVAGYNEDIAWGFTNGLDDVLDWYDITFRDESHAEYLDNGAWHKTIVRQETIKVRGGAPIVDRVVSTRHGPIVRWKDEPAFAGMDVPAGAALRWLGHDASNEIETLDALDRARNYTDFVEALKSWVCPAQNIAFADREGTIALWHDGKYPLRRKGQGRFVLDGSDPADDWLGWIPPEQVPHVKNPERGFVSSANQAPVDKSYPYYLGWDYGPFERGARINEILRTVRAVAPEDMIRMQTDVLDIRARAVLSALLEIVRDKAATRLEKRCWEELGAWDFEARAAFIAPTIFSEFWRELNRLTWDDETSEAMGRMAWPSSQVMIDLILNNPSSEFFDLGADQPRETLTDIANLSFKTAVAKLEMRLGPFGEAWRWGKVKGTELRHLARIPGFGREMIEADGAGHVIDAIDAVWGPSWRMVVELGAEVKAWGNYPGGQSGNPGSKFYEDRVEDWAAGRPYELLFLKSADEPNPRIIRRTVMRSKR